MLSIFLLRIILFIKGTKYTADKKIQSNDKNIQYQTKDCAYRTKEDERIFLSSFC